jgi:hypothetical protein
MLIDGESEQGARGNNRRHVARAEPIRDSRRSRGSYLLFADAQVIREDGGARGFPSGRRGGVKGAAVERGESRVDTRASIVPTVDLAGRLRSVIPASLRSSRRYSRGALACRPSFFLFLPREAIGGRGARDPGQRA